MMFRFIHKEKKSVLHTKKLLHCCAREKKHTTSIANHTALRNRKKEKFALEMMMMVKGRERVAAKKCEVVVVVIRDVLRVYNYTFTYIPPCSPFPLQPAQLHCVFSYVYISQQNLLSSSQMAKWIVVDVTVRVVLFSTIAFVVNFLDNFFLSFLQLHHEGKICFSFLCIFICYVRQLLGFFISHVMPPMIILMLSKMVYLREWKLFYRVVTILFLTTCLNLDCFFFNFIMTPDLISIWKLSFVMIKFFKLDIQFRGFETKKKEYFEETLLRFCLL